MKTQHSASALFILLAIAIPPVIAQAGTFAYEGMENSSNYMDVMSDREGRTWEYFAGYGGLTRSGVYDDYLTEVQAAKAVNPSLTLEDQLNLFGRSGSWHQIIDSFGRTGTTMVHQSNAYQIRLGAREPLHGYRYLSMGFFVDYTEGPSATYTYDTPTTFFGFPFTVSGNLRSKFFRGMFELSGKMPLSSRIALKLSGSGGIANATMSSHNVLYIAGLGIELGEVDKQWWDMSWEGSAGLVFNLGRTDLEVGYAIARFPQFSHSDTFGNFRWSPSMIYGSLNF